MNNKTKPVITSNKLNLAIKPVNLAQAESAIQAQLQPIGFDDDFGSLASNSNTSNPNPISPISEHKSLTPSLSGGFVQSNVENCDHAEQDLNQNQIPAQNNQPANEKKSHRRSASQ